MALDDLSDRDGYMADPASDVDSPRSAHMAIDDRSDGDGTASPVSSDGAVTAAECAHRRPVPASTTCCGRSRAALDDDSQRVAQAACADSEPSGSDHAVDDEDGPVRTRTCRCAANL
jgi:hypothetical protein